MSESIVPFTGPLLIAHLFNWGLFGVLCVQTYLYYAAFPKDRWIPKAIVNGALLLEIVQIILSTREAFRTFGTHFGDLVQLDTIGLQWLTVPVFVVVIGAVSQCFYAWRIWILSRQWYLPAVVLVFCLMQSIAGLWGAAITAGGQRFSEIIDEAAKPTGIWLGSTAVCDITIAFSMLYYLQRPNTSVKSTSTLLSKIIRVTVETGLICAAFALADLILFLNFRYNNLHLPFCSSLGKLYSNSLLAVLNARIRIRGGRDDYGNEDECLSVVLDTVQDSTLAGSSVPSGKHQLSKMSFATRTEKSGVGSERNSLMSV
ncbi:hypothetical protein C8Q75DRAFT_517786 [Abortiporus biennis]|nr:hypothetical protein C8Q75DRAFT_517786 [Abortiporus biennis]